MIDPSNVLPASLRLPASDVFTKTLAIQHEQEEAEAFAMIQKLDPTQKKGSSFKALLVSDKNRASIVTWLIAQGVATADADEMVHHNAKNPAGTIFSVSVHFIHPVGTFDPAQVNTWDQLHGVLTLLKTHGTGAGAGNATLVLSCDAFERAQAYKYSAQLTTDGFMDTFFREHEHLCI
eukprot:TRINITY_DN67979_c2_g4_i1.p1 TRINITY_DN67979_c2_g4~~TRINITY_DN67979_c2_g4_i1.p1  ORF type:complete len:178 (+),score=9.00 TRINITY_DN67979_c2_g4_i1:59-592(+)